MSGLFFIVLRSWINNSTALHCQGRVIDLQSNQWSTEWSLDTRTRAVPHLRLYSEQKHVRMSASASQHITEGIENDLITHISHIHYLLQTIIKNRAVVHRFLRWSSQSALGSADSFVTEPFAPIFGFCRWTQSGFQNGMKNKALCSVENKTLIQGYNCQRMLSQLL